MDKIVLIAPGTTEFPPKGWGACESIVWDYYENLTKRGYSVVIVNQADPNRIITETNNHKPSIVHIMYDDHIIVAPYIQCKKIYYTSHYAYITQPNFEQRQQWYFHNIFLRVIENQQYVTLNVISDQIKQIYVKYGFPAEKINVICNGSREDLFRFSKRPTKSDKSIYIAKVEFRKGQYKYQSLPNIDFVGNYHNSPFDKSNKNYLGEWTKPILYDNMTDYGNLVLLSDGEADPLVVKEALMAGLGLVLSECSCANLDLDQPFITVIPNDKLDNLAYIDRVIYENRKRSIECREQIREYAIEKFAWSNVIDRYCKMCI
uniref:Glycosyltransferase n=1 Tax=viral metagenome TaxID=1070528 RepID=A0A6C0AT70_9ZZZZ